MRTIIHSTTALGLVLSMSMPAPLMAQNANVCAEQSADRQFPCQLKNGDVMQSELDVLNARLERQQQALQDANNRLQIADGNQLEDQADVDARAQVAEAEAAIAQTQAFIEEERNRAAEAPAEATPPAQDQTADAQPEAEQPEAQQPETQQPEAQQPAGNAANQNAGNADQQDQQGQQAQQDQQGQQELTEEQRQAREERRAERQAERRAARRAAAAVAATEQGSQGEVQSETLTEEDVRSSDEEFATDATGDDGSDDDDGLSNFEKALAVGLGALAVGTVLNNGDEVVSRSGDRVVVERDGELRVLKDDNALLRQAGNEIQTENFSDGSTRTTVVKPGGDEVVTIRGSDGTVLRRVLVTSDGEEYTLVDDTQEEQEIEISALPAAQAEAQSVGERNEEELRAALLAEQQRTNGRNFSLRQIREVNEVRALAPQVELDAVRFATGSAAIDPEQARRLAQVGNTLRDMIAQDPRTVILVEGHTDAVGDASYNLALSDRRAETVALALAEYFDVPAENMITQGYGEASLKVQTADAEPTNRRAVVRNITALLR